MRHVCFAFPDERRCSSETLVRWYYNATTRNCVQFNYGGCGGNFNNFLSIEMCRDVCQSGRKHDGLVKFCAYSSNNQNARLIFFSLFSDSHPTAWSTPTTQPSPVYVSSRKPGTFRNVN